MKRYLVSGARSGWDEFYAECETHEEAMSMAADALQNGYLRVCLFDDETKAVKAYILRYDGLGVA